MVRVLTVLVVLLMSSSCYRTTVQTGLAPSAKKQMTWNHSWIAGVVPPAVVNAGSYCENGVALVETEISILNFVVGVVTQGIYTPMTITVTCAKEDVVSLSDSSSVVRVDEFADYQETMEAFSRASELAAEKEKPAYVVFESNE